MFIVGNHGLRRRHRTDSQIGFRAAIVWCSELLGMVQLVNHVWKDGYCNEKIDTL